MQFHRRYADAQLACDHLVREPVDEMLKDLAFPFGQGDASAVGAIGPIAAGPPKDRRHHVRRKEFIVRNHNLERLQHRVERQILVHDTVDAPRRPWGRIAPDLVREKHDDEGIVDQLAHGRNDAGDLLGLRSDVEKNELRPRAGAHMRFEIGRRAAVSSQLEGRPSQQVSPPLP